MGNPEGRHNRALRSHQLAMRMIRLEARPSTVAAWTKLTRERAGELAREYRQENVRNAHYLRGPSPTSLSTLMSSAYLRQELTAMAAVCQWVGVLPAQRLANARVTLPSVERGERLCEAVELYRRMVPHSRLTMEQTVLLVTALAEGEDCQISHCTGCSAVVLVDPLALHRGLCVACEREKKAGERLTAPISSLPDEVLVDPSVGIQQSLF